MPVISTGQLISPLEKLEGGQFILSQITYHLAPVMHGARGSSHEPGMNKMMLFPRLPWETAMPLQLGVQSGLNLPNPSSPHMGPARICQHTVPTAGQSIARTTHPDPACLGGR